jgi:hypothetical protein
VTISTSNQSGLASYWGTADTLDNCWEDSGESFPYGSYIRLNDVTPNITGVSPSSLNAGTSTPVHITGTGFGTTPTLSATDSNNAITGVSVTSVGPNSIDATISVAASTPAENVTLTVTSHGYNGQGFISNQGNSPVSPSINLSVTPIPAPVPQIQFKGSTITGMQPVVVGQRIELTRYVNAPLATTSDLWTVPGTIVGGFSANSSSALVLPVLSLAFPTVSYYWVTPSNSITVTYRYCMVNFECNSASATFSVGGIDNLTVSAPMNRVQIDPSTLRMGPGSKARSVPGIYFNKSAAIPPGSGTKAAFQWVQIVTNDTTTLRCGVTSDSTLVCKAAQTTYACVSRSGYPALDNYYPLPIVSDGNAVDIPSGPPLGTNREFEQAASFDATTFLMWDPALNSDGTGGCTPAVTDSLSRISQPSTCTGSIPIPLGYVNWHYSGDALNTFDVTQGVSGWNLVSADPLVADTNGPSFHMSSSYPQWNRLELNGELADTSKFTCTPQ